MPTVCLDQSDFEQVSIAPFAMTCNLRAETRYRGLRVCCYCTQTVYAFRVPRCAPIPVRNERGGARFHTQRLESVVC